MTKAELIAPGSPRYLQLRARAKEINDLHAAIVVSIDRVRAGAKIVIMNAALAGKALLVAKANVPHGKFLDWVAANCPNVSPVQSAKYMTLARNWEKLSALQEADSLRQALIMCSDDKEKTNGHTPKEWPEDLEGVRRFTRVIEYVEKHPLTKWHEESKIELRYQLEPVVRQLWPEKFDAIDV